MPYIVTLKLPKGKEMSLDQFLFAQEDHPSAHRERLYPGTVTRYCDSLPHGLYAPKDIRRLIDKLSQLKYMTCWHPQSLKSQYQIFKIPKRSGGERIICAPQSRLYQDQLELRTLFEKDFCALYHTTAFAYCKGRSIKRCIQRHQANKSRWFLKLDFENFFGNTNKDFVLRQLNQIAPFSEVMHDPIGKEMLTKAIDICFLDDGLPQGTPISPMLTNLVMIPFDHQLNKLLHQRGFVYTRYADDIQISHREKFNPDEVCNIVNNLLCSMNMPYALKQQKTRFGSVAGRNWNLGLMLNGENHITIGHREHKLMKARMHSFIMDVKSGKRWTLKDTQRLAGQLAYFRSIEPHTAQHIITQLNQKLNVDFMHLLHAELKQSDKRSHVINANWLEHFFI